LPGEPAMDAGPAVVIAGRRQIASMEIIAGQTSPL
jgi:hypothetical protein